MKIPTIIASRIRIGCRQTAAIRLIHVRLRRQTLRILRRHGRPAIARRLLGGSRRRWRRGGRRRCALGAAGLRQKGPSHLGAHQRRHFARICRHLLLSLLLTRAVRQLRLAALRLQRHLTHHVGQQLALVARTVNTLHRCHRRSDPHITVNMCCTAAIAAATAAGPLLGIEQKVRQRVSLDGQRRELVAILLQQGVHIEMLQLMRIHRQQNVAGAQRTRPMRRTARLHLRDDERAVRRRRYRRRSRRAAAAAAAAARIARCVHRNAEAGVGRQFCQLHVEHSAGRYHRVGHIELDLELTPMRLLRGTCRATGGAGRSATTTIHRAGGGGAAQMIAENLPDDGHLQIVQLIDGEHAVAFEDAAASVGHRVRQHLRHDVAATAGALGAQHEAGALAAVEHDLHGLGATPADHIGGGSGGVLLLLLVFLLLLLVLIHQHQVRRNGTLAGVLGAMMVLLLLLRMMEMRLVLMVVLIMGVVVVFRVMIVSVMFTRLDGVVVVAVVRACKMQ